LIVEAAGQTMSLLGRLRLLLRLCDGGTPYHGRETALSGDGLAQSALVDAVDPSALGEESACFFDQIATQ
jgi:hypothetical protein